ncbi:1-hydroxycarotenoid 3,4-desaturase CrtD [Pedobacter sp. SYSU D00535]|uniref:1-hydroxycarotenoid 3,4-desaturase CrtD n=1 Tax=Pedobacter sp. SYSU D00535 TaxID=2810308 RepID=UPI001A96729B|nr:1-hydroxycarotenoid 3,4-desaturase CrtD [Pedobacter sp. SYSU D00535]
MAKAIVIGAGIGGIAAAIRLALQGMQVEVFEANAQPGGKLSELLLKDFRFDAGPSLFTMPFYVDELFTLAGKNPREYFNYQKLERICNYFYEDETAITAWADRDRFTSEIAAKTIDSKEAVEAFLQKSEEIYNITHHVFLERSLHKLSTYLNTKTLHSLLKVGKIDSLRSMNAANASRFRDSKTQRFFNRYATYNGSNPYQAPATLNVIPHLEQHFGAYFPEGGMYAIVQSLVRLATELGVQFNYNSPVERILVDKRSVRGVVVDGRERKADLVVSNMDVWFTYKKLLNHEVAPAKVLAQERSSSALIFYWGIRRQFPQLDLHNIFFSEDYQKEFSHIWNEKSIYDDPTVYLNISSKYNAADAPPNEENWFVMINVPSNSGQNWDLLIAEARDNIIRKLSRILKEDIRTLIACEALLDPRSIESKTYSYQGSLYGTSSNSRFAAFFRHPNFSSKIANLYFVGGSVHPGGGIPLALLSARIVSQLVADGKN